MTRRYPLIGGVAAWRVPFVATLVTAGALLAGAWDVAVGAAVAGGVVHALWRSLVLEVSAVGLTRGFVLKGTFLGRATVLPWAAVVEVRTAWCRPRDDSALETTVCAADGGALRFSTGMGLAAYWACLDAVVRRAPWAVRAGVTDAVLAEGPPARRAVASAALIAGTLALLLVALAGLHYLWAQGRSSLSRALEDVAGPRHPDRGP